MDDFEIVREEARGPSRQAETHPIKSLGTEEHLEGFVITLNSESFSQNVGAPFLTGPNYTQCLFLDCRVFLLRGT